MGGDGAGPEQVLHQPPEHHDLQAENRAGADHGRDVGGVTPIRRGADRSSFAGGAVSRRAGRPFLQNFAISGRKNGRETK